MAGRWLTGETTVSVEVVTGTTRLRQLGDAWRDLWGRCADAGLYQTFEYCRDAWELVQRPQGCSLVCLAGWQGDQLVAVWPFVTVRHRAWTWAEQLGASGAELHDLLVDDALDRETWVRQAWDVLTGQSGADVVRLSFSDDRPGARALRSLPGRVSEFEAAVSVRVALREQADWDGYYRSLSASHRKDLAKSARRLAELGAVEFEVVEAGDPRIPALVEWTLAQKREWAEHTGKKGEWLYSDRYRQFLVDQLNEPGHTATNVLMVVRLEGRPLATQIGAIGKDCFEAVIAGFDAAHRRHSPGARMQEAVVRWAWEQRLDCDLGGGAEPYKTMWSRNQVVARTNGELAVSRWGAVALVARRRVRRSRARRAELTARSSAG